MTPSIGAVSGSKAEYPADHRPGMRVPKGGSDCAKCRYLKGQDRCSNKYFQRWHGSDRIPAPIDEYCSDYFEPSDSEKAKMRNA